MKPYDPIAIALGLEPFDFREFAPFNTGSFAVFRGDGVEQSDWELHPDTDELLFVLSGSVTIEMLTTSGSEHHPLVAGQFVVVPKSCWHRHVGIRDLIEMYFTPGTSIQSTSEDPRA